MSNQDFSFWNESEIDLDSATGKEVEKLPKPSFSEVEEFSIPDKLTMTWIKNQLPASVWKKAASKGGRCNPNMIASMAKHATKTPSKRAIMARMGMSERTWYLWENKAALGEQPYALWYQCMMHSFASIEDELLDNIRGHAMSDWKAATWLLSRMNKEEFAENKGNSGTTNVTIEGDSGTKVTINTLTQDDANAIGKIFTQIGAFDPNVIDGEVVEDDE
jgi:hypothetical protein